MWLALSYYRSYTDDQPPNGLRYTPTGYMWAGVDSAWVQEKLEARKIIVNRADSYMSGARFYWLLDTTLLFEPFSN